MEASPQTNAYSVLMPVYAGEQPEYLSASLESLLTQTVPSDDIVVTCDGPLTPALDAVLDQVSGEHPGLIQIVRLPRHGGIVPALNAGLSCCRHELVARMDSDDIACPDRCGKQLAVFARCPEIAVCSGTVEEFRETPDRVTAVKRLPETTEEILRYARSRNPFNHPCVMFRKSAVLSVGAYEEFHYLEDYQLWVKLLARGYAGCNLSDTLLHMRTGRSLYLRRGGFQYGAEQIRFCRWMYKIHFISLAKCVTGSITRFGLAILPNHLRRFIYEKVIRK